MTARRNSDFDELKARPRRTPEEVAAAELHVRGILAFLGEDPEREGLLDTPARVVRAYAGTKAKRTAIWGDPRLEPARRGRSLRADFGPALDRGSTGRQSTESY